MKVIFYDKFTVEKNMRKTWEWKFPNATGNDNR